MATIFERQQRILKLATEIFYMPTSAVPDKERLMDTLMELRNLCEEAIDQIERALEREA